MVSTLIGLVFGISQGKIIENIMTNLLLVLGTVIFVIISIIIKLEEDKRNALIEKLEVTKD